MRIIDDLTGRYSKGVENQRLFCVVHHTASGNATLNNILRFFRLSSAVSIHYVVGREGEIVRMVPEDKVAWHCGVSEWQGKTDLNRYSIGIEVLSDGKSFTDAQRFAVWELCKNIIERNKLSPMRVVRHADVAPKRKTDIAEPFWRPFGEKWGAFQMSLRLKKYPLLK